ncbi:hypothetical protein VTN31DRAFT_1223 [Thermomyces dupontii]|uniref:uncharacterized protein n=1 Tax=Talaromyces thermophilus TaxID=28565 RepID=UPI0037442057
MTIPPAQRGRRAGKTQQPRIKEVGNTFGTLLPSTIRPNMTLLHYQYSAGCLDNPTAGQDSETASTELRSWWSSCPPQTWSSLAMCLRGQRSVGYGYTIYAGVQLIDKGCAPISPDSHAFDAEAIGALRGAQRAIELRLQATRFWLCIDNTSVIWCARDQPPVSSNWPAPSHGAIPGISQLGTRPYGHRG